MEENKHTAADRVETITSLIEKLEGAEGPSIVLDAEIFWELERDKATQAFCRGAMGLPKALPDEFVRLPQGMGMASLEAYSPPFTGRLHEIVSLFERLFPGWAWNIDRWGKMSRVTLNECDAEGWRRSRHRRIEVAVEQPPSIAVCIAVLRAQSEARV